MDGQTINSLPSNLDAEKSIIGSVLVQKTVPLSAKNLRTIDFYNSTHRAIWSAFLELEEDGHEIDPFETVEILKRNQLGVPIGVAELVNYTTGIALSQDRTLVKEILEASNRRFLIHKLQAGITALEVGGKDVIPNLRRQLSEIENTESSKGNFRWLSEIIDQDVKPALQDLRDGITRKIQTGWSAIDKAIGGGISLTDVLLVAAPPGSGKSAFVLQLACNIAKQGYPVAYLSGEMSDRENGLRLVSQASQSVNLNSVDHISEDDLTFFNEWADALKQLPICFDSKTFDLASVSRSLRALVEEKDVQVLVIDYIQLLELNKVDKLKRYERITEVSQEVKRIAMEFGIAVIEVAQFNREGAKSGKPTMHDLEGSSQLEKDTSLIFLLDREEGTPNVTLRIVKGRNVGNTAIEGHFAGWKLNFSF